MRRGHAYVNIANRIDPVFRMVILRGGKCLAFAFASTIGSAQWFVLGFESGNVADLGCSKRSLPQIASSSQRIMQGSSRNLCAESLETFWLDRHTPDLIGGPRS
jgi:hypothetical protein